MSKTWTTAIAVGALAVASTAFAQNAATVIANASRAMGADGMTSVTYYGSGANYNLGQNNNANQPWPRVNVNDYRRTINILLEDPSGNPIELFEPKVPQAHIESR